MDQAQGKARSDSKRKQREAWSVTVNDSDEMGEVSWTTCMHTTGNFLLCLRSINWVLAFILSIQLNNQKKRNMMEVIWSCWDRKAVISCLIMLYFKSWDGGRGEGNVSMGMKNGILIPTMVWREPNFKHNKQFYCYCRGKMSSRYSLSSHSTSLIFLSMQ